VLAMIEVNLLPPEYRPRETTNVPFMATLVLGFLVIGGLFLYWMKAEAELAELKSTNDALTRKKEELEREAKKVDAIREEIERQKSRQQTIIEISQSKVMWSMKLEQLSSLMTDYKNFWTQSLSLTKTGGRGSTLVMRCSAANSTLNDIARFRDSLQNDPNFWYHFDRLDSFSYTRSTLTGFKNATEKYDFEIKLPLQTGGKAAE
jgi:Tfp pilus assembly protein PilN